MNPTTKEVPRRIDFVHHQDSIVASFIRDIVFGMEDGMVSTLGTITGIAVGSRDQGTVLLAGLVIVAVESISMGIGSYLSSSSEKKVDERKIQEEKKEISEYPETEEKELLDIYIQNGWPENLAKQMSETAGKNHNLMLNEMAHYELSINPNDVTHPIKNGVFMFLSYIIGGTIPLLAYLLLPIKQAMPISIGVTLSGLFLLGVATTKYTKQKWVKEGSYMLLLGGAALSAGFLIGKFAGGGFCKENFERLLLKYSNFIIY